jgi:hypothetical protein
MNLIALVQKAVGLRYLRRKKMILNGSSNHG